MTTATTTYLCIECPLGCRLEVDDAEGEIVEVRGFSCKRGAEYARQEHVDPRRTVTTTVAVSGSLWPRLPVKTAHPVPKSRVRDVCAWMRGVRVAAPVALGQIVARDVLGLGVDMVATRDMPKLD